MGLTERHLLNDEGGAWEPIGGWSDKPNLSIHPQPVCCQSIFPQGVPNGIKYPRKDKVIEGTYPEFEAFIWQPSIMRYKSIRPNEPISELSLDIVGEFIHQLFMLHAFKDYSIEYEISDRWDRSLKHTAHLYLKELEE